MMTHRPSNQIARFWGRKENLSLSLKRKSRARTASAAPEVAPTKRPCLVAVNADRFAFSNEDSYGKMSVPINSLCVLGVWLINPLWPGGVVNYLSVP